MMRAIRHFFLTRALREKLLLVAFIAIGALWWSSAVNQRLIAFWRAQRITTARLSEQAQWIKNRTRIEQAAQKTAERLDPARTLNGNQLVTTVAQLATDAGLRDSRSGTPTTQKSGQFAVHSAEYIINQAGWDQLKAFYEALQQRSPYISVERFGLSAAANAPAKLTLNVKVVSVEIVP